MQYESNFGYNCIQIKYKLSKFVSVQVSKVNSGIQSAGSHGVYGLWRVMTSSFNTCQLGANPQLSAFVNAESICGHC